MDMNIKENLSFNDKSNSENGHGLRGHVSIFRQNKTNGEKTLWYENDNVISISGYQYILMKMFGLYLDSKHSVDGEDLGKHTSLAMPDMNFTAANKGLNIGVDPASYSTFAENIPSSHFIQGFMVGNGGSGEDAITTKNTDYSYIKLRNPIPFRTTNSLSSSLATKYIGVYRDSSTTKQYFIKKFDSTPYIYHGWWNADQAWDTYDPITADSLGPQTGTVPKSSRIETYAECALSIDEADCMEYFNNNTNQSAVLNELGLVAFDISSANNTRAEVETIYNDYVKDLLLKIFVDGTIEEADFTAAKALANTVYTKLYTEIGIGRTMTQSENLTNFLTKIKTELIDKTYTTGFTFGDLQTALENATTNIGVQAYYDHSGTVQYTTDNFITKLADIPVGTGGLTVGDAERIKTITYYTFNSIPLDANYQIIIKYRIYAN